jgi:hypothetical protein
MTSQRCTDTWAARNKEFMDGTRDLPFGLKGTGITSIQIACNREHPNGEISSTICPLKHGSNASAANLSTVIKYWHDLHSNFSKQGWSELLFDYTIDEPHITGDSSKDDPDWAHLKMRADAVHAANTSLRTLVTTEFCREFQDLDGKCIVPPEVVQANVSGEITLWVPLMQYIAGRSNIPLHAGTGGGTAGHPYHCKDVPLASQRHTYDFIKQPEQHLWWYFACLSEGGCCPGPQRKCTKQDTLDYAQLGCSVPCLMGWPTYMIDHSAISNRMVQWATFLYDMHGACCFEHAVSLEDTWTLHQIMLV